MRHAPKELRRQRCITATDSEWAMISSRAGSAGTSNSRFLVRRALEPAVPALADTAPDTLPPAVQRRMALAMLMLLRIEEQRLRSAEGGAALWAQLMTEETQFLETARALGDDA